MQEVLVWNFISYVYIPQLHNAKIKINRKLNLLKVKAINLIKKHQKPTKENKGGIISKESFVHYSNVKNLETKKEAVKK